MLRIAMAAFAVGSLLVLGALDTEACTVPCACLDVDGEGAENDLVCCGAEQFDVADAVSEGQACGRLRAAPPGPFVEPTAEIAGRISSEGVMGCGCLDPDQNGEAEAIETFPPGQDCARTAAIACLSGHEPPARQCATIFFDACQSD